MRSFVVAQCGWRRAGLAIIAGAASALALAPLFLAPVLLVSLPVLLWLAAPEAALSRASGTRASARARFAAGAWIGWCFGFGYHLAGLYWIGFAFLVEAEKFASLLPFAVMAMPAGLALFIAVAVGVTALAPDRALARVLALTIALAGAEWLRGHILTGFPWNIIGYALTGPLIAMQAAGLIGIYGLTVVTVLAASLPLAVFADGHATRASRRAAVLVPVALLVALATYGAIRLALPVPADVGGARLRIVQPSVAQTDKWRPDKQREIFHRHLSLSGRSPDGVDDGLAGITHVVWPEASMPFLPLDSPEAIAAIGRLLPSGVQLIAGGLRVEQRVDGAGGMRRDAYNSTMVFDNEGRLVGLYDKIHLVPFGEYLPFQSTLESIGLEQLSRMKGGFASGARPRRPMTISGLPPIGMLICYEAIFPGAVVQGGVRPAGLFNVTNDGWFGRSSGPYQHLHQSRVRAVEEGLPLIRIANNGVSAVVGPYGRLRASIPLDVAGTIDTALPGAIAPPPYARFGDVPFLLMLLGLLAVLAVQCRGRVREVALPH